jgi:hypothetical protein
MKVTYVSEMGLYLTKLGLSQFVDKSFEVDDKEYNRQLEMIRKQHPDDIEEDVRARAVARTLYKQERSLLPQQDVLVQTNKKSFNWCKVLDYVIKVIVILLLSYIAAKAQSVNQVYDEGTLIYTRPTRAPFMLDFYGAPVTCIYDAVTGRAKCTITVGAAGVTDVTATTPLFSSGGATPNLTIQVATGAQDGYLSSANWTTFNNKQAAISTHAAVANNFLTGFTAPNTFTAAQPTWANIDKTVSSLADLATRACANLSDAGTGCSGTSYPGLVAHNILSASHGDTVAASAVRGDIIIANSTPAWTKLALGAATSGKYAKSNGTDVIISTGSASGTGACGANTWASTLNADAAPTCTTPRLDQIANPTASKSFTTLAGGFLLFTSISNSSQNTFNRFQNQCAHSTATACYGLDVLATTTLSPGTLASGKFRGITAVAKASSGGETLTDAYAIYGQIEASNTGTITSGMAFYAATPVSAGGTLTNTYGLYIANQTGAVTGNYAIKTNTGLVDFGDITLAKRFKASNGTALVAGDFALSAGWGSTAAIATITGTDQAFQGTITSTGTGQAINPTLTLTFQNGTWTTVPIFVCSQNGGTGALSFLTVAPTATTAVITYTGTPVAALTYIISCVGMGI